MSPLHRLLRPWRTLRRTSPGGRGVPPDSLGWGAPPLRRRQGLSSRYAVFCSAYEHVLRLGPPRGLG